MKLYMETLILCPGRAAINHGQAAVPTTPFGSSADTVLARYPVESRATTTVDADVAVVNSGPAACSGGSGPLWPAVGV